MPRRFLKVLGLAPWVALVCLLGCGEDSSSGGTETPSATPGGTAKPAPTPPPSPSPPEGVVEEDEVLRELSNSLKNQELAAEIRVWVAAQIGATPGPAATRTLVEALSVDDEAVRHAVVDALVAREDPGVKAALEAASAHSDPYVMRKVRERLDQ